MIKILDFLSDVYKKYLVWKYSKSNCIFKLNESNVYLEMFSAYMYLDNHYRIKFSKNIFGKEKYEYQFSDPKTRFYFANSFFEKNCFVSHDSILRKNEKWITFDSKNNTNYPNNKPTLRTMLDSFFSEIENYKYVQNR